MKTLFSGSHFGQHQTLSGRSGFPKYIQKTLKTSTNSIVRDPVARCTDHETHNGSFELCRKMVLHSLDFGHARRAAARAGQGGKRDLLAFE